MFGYDAINKWMAKKTQIVTTIRKVEKLPSPAISILPLWKSLINPTHYGLCPFSMEDFWDCIGNFNPTKMYNNNRCVAVVYLRI